MSPPAISPGLYRHYKGQSYRVLGCVRHSETDQWLVLYRAIYGEHGFWVRPASMFAETVEVAGKQQPRFALQYTAPGIDEILPITQAPGTNLRDD